MKIRSHADVVFIINDDFYFFVDKNRFGRTGATLPANKIYEIFNNKSKVKVLIVDKKRNILSDNFLTSYERLNCDFVETDPIKLFLGAL